MIIFNPILCSKLQLIFTKLAREFHDFNIHQRVIQSEMSMIDSRYYQGLDPRPELTI